MVVYYVVLGFINNDEFDDLFYGYVFVGVNELCCWVVVEEVGCVLGEGVVFFFVGEDVGCRLVYRV